MNDGDNEDREREIRERIVRLMRANEQAAKAPITDDEKQKLNAAAARLDQMLKTAADAEGQILISAAARLDQLLTDISEGKDISNDIKRRKSAESSPAE